MQQYELAWAAGFYDGEGSSWLRKPHTGKPEAWSTIVVSVSQTDEEVLRRFQAAVGGVGRLRVKYEANGNRKKAWEWETSTAQAIKVMEDLWPYLSQAKRNQFYILLERKRQLIPEHGRGNRKGSWRTCTLHPNDPRGI